MDKTELENSLIINQCEEYNRLLYKQIYIWAFSCKYLKELALDVQKIELLVRQIRQIRQKLYLLNPKHVDIIKRDLNKLSKYSFIKTN